MKALEEIKNEHAKNHGFSDWKEFCQTANSHGFSDSEVGIDELLVLAVNSALQEAAEEHERRRDLCNFQYWLAHNHKGNLPTDSTEMTKRAIEYLKTKNEKL